MKENVNLLAKRMKELRERNGLSMETMAKKLNLANKSSISRAEAGQMSQKSLVELAKAYCTIFKMSPLQTEQFLRGEKIVIIDTSALLKNVQIIDELSKEYYKVIIPKIVIDEIDNIKNSRQGALSRKAWEAIRAIGSGTKTLLRDYDGSANAHNNDYKIICIAQAAAEEFSCKADIITDDADYSAYLKGNTNVRALPLQEYLATKQQLVDIVKLKAIDECFALDYSQLKAPTETDINAYLEDGNTLLISTVRNHMHSLAERKAKISWLIKHGADVDKRDCGRRYFPPLTHAVQAGDFEIFLFLLEECQANPNVVSRNPHDAGKLRQKNEGNTALMVAAWEGKAAFVEALCKDARTSLNQQDANGFTALIKACANKNLRCRDILLQYKADTKIVDLDGNDYARHLQAALQYGPLRNRSRGSKK